MKNAACSGRARPSTIESGLGCLAYEFVLQAISSALYLVKNILVKPNPSKGKMMMKRIFVTAVGTLALLAVNSASAEDYVIDTAHTSIQFKIAHLGYSWLYGRFNTFSGEFSYDEKNPDASRVSVEIDTASVDSSHAERDKHLRSDDFLDVKEYPKAKFVSTSFSSNGSGTGVLKGDFTLHGVTKPLSIAVKQVGAGKDPWGGYRRGFEGITKLALKDYNINHDQLGPASAEVELILNVEGKRK